ncbi:MULTISPECIES: hypothetical protein [unclassified Sphingobacterium]|uniref:hypothetical protein n=1 Tax=unclassified Sphingobacterium TaxID=2609468 RepID=UPI0020C4A554|nr:MULTISPECIES: hypothetical protein [unclassified Sphingobacterium]
MYKFRAKVLISKKPTCHCGGFYHPGEVFTEENLQTAKRYITKGLVEVLESPQEVEEKEQKEVRKTKEFKG